MLLFWTFHEETRAAAIISPSTSHTVHSSSAPHHVTLQPLSFVIVIVLSSSRCCPL